MPVIDYPNGSNDANAVILTDDTTQLQVTTGSATQSGVISESGGSHGLEKTGIGTLILASDETYTGRTVISGGTLQLGTSTIGGSVAGDIVDDGNLVWLSAPIYSGSITGTGTIKIGDSSTQTDGVAYLTGTNNFDGTTTVSYGTLVLGNNTSTGSLTGDIVIGDSGSNGHAFMSIERNNDYTLSANISGAGELDKYGPDVVTLTGNNSAHTGTTDIIQGVLAVTSAANLGSGLVKIGGGGTVRFLSSFTTAANFDPFFSGTFDTLGNTVVLTGTISEGELIKVGTGTLVLAGTAPYGGTATINAGTLALQGTYMPSSIIDNGNLDISQSGATLSGLTGNGTVSLGHQTLVITGGSLNGSSQFNGTFQDGGIAGGSGGILEIANLGVLSLTGYLNQTGGTIIDSGGTLLLPDGFTSAGLGNGPLVDNGVISFGVSGGGVLSKSISGSGSLYAGGAPGWAPMIVTANNSYTGGTGIEGNLQVGDGGTTGSLGSGGIGNYGKLTFDRSDEVTIADFITGNGFMNQNGSGNLILNGGGDLSGATTVNAGTLTVDSSFASSPITVNSGGKLGGTGTVGLTAIMGGATLAPGTIGTLHVNNRLVLLSDATYGVEFSPSASASTAVNGQASITGNLVEKFDAGAYTPGTTYTIMSSTGSLTGAFSNISVSGLPAGLRSFTSYDGNHVYATLARYTPIDDFDGDGKSDFLWQNDNGQPAIWLMNGTAETLGTVVGSNPGTSWHVKSAGDFDGDGKSDILWQNDDGSAAIWQMNGTTENSGAIVGSNPGPNWHIKGAGDFDNDGKADILWQNDNGSAAIWLMNGSTETAGVIVGSNPGTSWHIKAAADFNGDGKADILWQNDNGQAAIWLMDGTTETSGVVLGSNPGPKWHIKGAGDFNGDGKADILWQNDNGSAEIWLMNGTTETAGAVVGSNPGPSWQVVGAGDLNGDGKSDILWQNSNGQAGAWLMNGTSVLSTANVGSNPGTAWHMIAASA